MSEYEQQRISRIKENKARLEALGLPNLAYSFNIAASSSSSPKAKQSKKIKSKRKEDVDEEYKPSSDEEDTNHDDDEEYVEDSSTSLQKGKRKSSSNATSKKILLNKRIQEEYNHTDDDSALQHAIALSLGRIMEDKFEAGGSERGEKDKADMQEAATRRKSKKMNKSRIQLTEDEVIAYFFSFDEAGKGQISYRDVERMVFAHDFSWSEMEIASMISSFDRDKDGKISLEDFRAIVCRCNMIQESE